MILVTGATGLLGSHVVFDLIKKGHRVKAMYRNEEKQQVIHHLLHYYQVEDADKLFDLIEWFKGDILDLQDVANAVKNCKSVIHCAGMVSFASRDFNKLIDVNRNGTANMVNEALSSGIDHFLHVSSTSAVGSDSVFTDNVKRESNHWHANEKASGYGVSKYSAEKEVWRGIEEGLTAVIVNPSVFFGPGSWSESSLQLYQTIKNGLSFFTAGGNAFVDVRDVSEIICRLHERRIANERYLVTGHALLFKDVIDQIADQMGVKKPRYKVGEFATAIALRLIGIYSFLTGKQPSITKDTARSSHEVTVYSSEKIKTLFPDFEFTPVTATIANTIKGKMN
jgi:nucleoside-diphosphate-sugar epimerase